MRSYLKAAAQPGIAADRFARKIVRFLAVVAMRSRRLAGSPLGGTTTLVKFDCLLLRYNDAAPVSICRVARKGRSRNAMDPPYQAIITINNQTKCHSVATILSETMLLVSRRESSGHCSWLI